MGFVSQNRGRRVSLLIFIRSYFHLLWTKLSVRTWFGGVWCQEMETLLESCALLPPMLLGGSTSFLGASTCQAHGQCLCGVFVAVSTRSHQLLPSLRSLGTARLRCRAYPGLVRSRFFQRGARRREESCACLLSLVG